MEFLKHDIADENFLRLIVRFLKAGVMEEGKYIRSDVGTPQGGLISPILANIYLHYVLDLWFEKRVRKQMRGESYIVRYAATLYVLFNTEHKELSPGNGSDALESVKEKDTERQHDVGEVFEDT